MGRKERAKGYRGEWEWARVLGEMGLEAKRIPLSGAAPGFKGDVLAILPGAGEVAWSVKRRRSLPQWLKELPAAVREDRGEWVILLPLTLFRSMVEWRRQG